MSSVRGNVGQDPAGQGATGQGATGQDAVVSTAAGQLSGVQRGTVSCWRGVPYAAPPVGAIRFRSPRPVPSWSGVRPALRSAGAATQALRIGGSVRRLGETVGEDCLYLNVYAPSAARTDGRLRPVLVWVHGGAYTSGSGALYDGTPLAEEGDIVVVTVNYRLGVFGFVDLASAVDAEVPTNLGLRDQVAALRWVQENIAAFGGDPTQVTVGGESAGSVSVSMLVASPHTAGLFSAAILQSGSFSLVHGDQTRVEVARHYARILGLGRRDGDRLWQLPAAELAAAQRQVNQNTPGTVPASPWFDGDLVPGTLAEAQRAAARPDLVLLAGHNHDEVTLFQRLPGDIMPTSRAALTARLRAELGWDRAAELLACYPATARGTVALGTDLNFAMPTRHFAERHAAAGGASWFYRFDARGPLLGATHAAELVYLWGWTGPTALLLRGRRTSARAQLAARMRAHWLSFVRTRAPGADWPAYTGLDRATRVFDPAGDRVALDPAGERRRAWAGQDVMPRS